MRCDSLCDKKITTKSHLFLMDMCYSENRKEMKKYEKNIFNYCSYNNRNSLF